jgi:hypothetical protein
MFDMLGPGIDERHVLTCLRHMGAGISADRTRSDDSYLPTHAFLPAILAAEVSATAGLTANGEPHRTGRRVLFACGEVDLDWLCGGTCDISPGFMAFAGRSNNDKNKQ